MTEYDHREVRDRLVAACRHLASAGLSPGSSGNLSVRVDGGILITPTGSAMSRVNTAALAFVPDTGEASSGPRPSKELPLHVAVYEKRKDAEAVVHLHSPYATALSCLTTGTGRAWLPNLTPYRVMRLGDVPLCEYAAPGSAALAAGVAAQAGAHPVLLLANHGCVVAGTSLESACDLAEELETSAQLTLLLDSHLQRPASLRAVELNLELNPVNPIPDQEHA